MVIFHSYLSLPEGSDFVVAGIDVSSGCDLPLVDDQFKDHTPVCLPEGNNPQVVYLMTFLNAVAVVEKQKRRDYRMGLSGMSDKLKHLGWRQDVPSLG